MIPSKKFTTFSTLQKAIFTYFKELNETQTAVLFALRIADKTVEPKLKQRYQQDAALLKYTFEKECRAFLSTIDRYIVLERKKKQPVNFQVRKIKRCVERVFK